MRYLTTQDRLLGQALTGLRRPFLRVSTIAFLSLLLGGLLVSASLAVEYFELNASALGRGLLDITQQTSLASWYTGLLLLVASAACAVLSRLDRRDPRPSNAWRWGCMAFFGLALAQTLQVEALFGQMLESGLLGLSLDAATFGPLVFLFAFGGFFALALWRQRRRPLIALATLLGYAAWTLSYTGIPYLTLEPLLQSALVPSLRLFGSSMVLWGLLAHVLHAANYTTPLPILSRHMRYAA